MRSVSADCKRIVETMQMLGRPVHSRDLVEYLPDVHLPQLLRRLYECGMVTRVRREGDHALVWELTGRWL